MRPALLRRPSSLTTRVALLAAALQAAVLFLMTPPAAATGNPILLGIYRPEIPGDLSAFDEYQSNSGQRLSIVHWFALWGGWKGAFSRADLDAITAHGATPMITWEPWDGRPDAAEWSLRAGILSGQNDRYVESWAEGLAAYQRPVLLRFAHEMHDQTYPWAVGANGNTADDYVAAWRYVHGFFERAGATNVQWVWNPNTRGDAPSAEYAPLYRSLYPGDDYVDRLGLDIYNTGPDVNWGAPYWRTFRQVLDEPYRALTAVADKPVILAEVGSTETGGSKAVWITEALGSQLPVRFPRVSALVWFDVTKEARWALGSSPAAFEAWTAAARQTQFAANPVPPS